MHTLWNSGHYVRLGVPARERVRLKDLDAALVEQELSANSSSASDNQQCSLVTANDERGKQNALLRPLRLQQLALAPLARLVQMFGRATQEQVVEIGAPYW